MGPPPPDPASPRNRDWTRPAGAAPTGDRAWRARRRRDRGQATFDGRAEIVESLPADGLRRGARIFHRKFGYGTVAKVEGDRLDIEFDKAGRKKVIAGFVVPADQAG